MLVEIVSFVEVNQLLIAARANKPARLFFLEGYNVSCMSIGDKVTIIKETAVRGLRKMGRGNYSGRVRYSADLTVNL